MTAWGSRNLPVSLLAVHHWRKGRTALRWFSLLLACQASMSAWRHAGQGKAPLGEPLEELGGAQDLAYGVASARRC